MSNTEQVLSLDEDSSQVSLSRCCDKTFSASRLLFESSSPAAIAADGRQEATSPVPEGPLTPQILDCMTRSASTTTTFDNIWKTCRRSGTGTGRLISAKRALRRRLPGDIRGPACSPAVRPRSTR
jgi:hypothetical protein